MLTLLAIFATVCILDGLLWGWHEAEQHYLAVDDHPAHQKRG